MGWARGNFWRMGSCFGKNRVKCTGSTNYVFLVDMLHRAYPEEMVCEDNVADVQGAQMLSMMPPEQLVRGILLEQRGEDTLDLFPIPDYMDDDDDDD